MGMDANSFDGRQAFFYVEYGLLERLTLVSQVNFGVLTDEDRFARSETTGLGDWEIGAKYQAIDGPVVVAPQVLVKLPTGYHTDYVPPLGTGEVDLEARLLVSRSLYPRPVYVGIDGGYRVRGGPFSNQLSWGVELGATPHARVFAKLFAGGTNSLTSGDGADLGVVGGSTQVSEGDFTKAGINGAVEIAGGLWVDVLVERVVDGENIGAGTSWGLGLSVSR